MSVVGKPPHNLFPVVEVAAAGFLEGPHPLFRAGKERRFNDFDLEGLGLTTLYRLHRIAFSLQRLLV